MKIDYSVVSTLTEAVMDETPFFSELAKPTVTATLRGSKTYQVHLALTLKQLVGQSGTDGVIVVGEELGMNQLVVEDGAYVVGYEFGGTSFSVPVDIVEGKLRRVS